MAVAGKMTEIKWGTIDRHDIPGEASYTPGYTVYTSGEPGTPGYVHVSVGAGHLPSSNWVGRPTADLTYGHRYYEDPASATAVAVISEAPPVYQSVTIEMGFPRGEAYRTPDEYDQLAQIMGQAAISAAQVVEQNATKIIASE